MKILGVETASSRGGVALAEDDRVVAELLVDNPRQQAERIVPSIDAVLRGAGWKFSDLDFIAVSVGPGSFTGVRIGLSTVKGLAMAGNIPIVPVPTLDAFALELSPFNGTIRPILDSRKNVVLTASYDGLGKRIGEYINISPDDLAAEMAKEIPIMIAGDGAVKYRDNFLKSLGKNVSFPPEDKHPSPGGIARLGYKLFHEGKSQKPELAVPIFVSKSDVEFKRIT